jgi:hypothetical protein
MPISRLFPRRKEAYIVWPRYLLRSVCGAPRWRLFSSSRSAFRRRLVVPMSTSKHLSIAWPWSQKAAKTGYSRSGRHNDDTSYQQCRRQLHLGANMIGRRRYQLPHSRSLTSRLETSQVREGLSSGPHVFASTTSVSCMALLIAS